ncbi:MAG: lamin tail domain-containing protein [Ruminococcaceae bacterium]|nr:lamin tail domain-containing protein [Oscillospiraceae bacterium]
MKKFLSILLAVLMIAGLVPALFASAATGTAGKATAITADKNGRTYHYYESFDTDTTVQGADKVMATLGWTLPDDETFVGAHEANVNATEKGTGVYMYEIKNGRLYLRNRGTKNEYMLIGNAGEMAEAFDGAYVVEYTMTYLASSTSKDDGYVSFIYNATDRLHQYAESVIRISGWGNSRMILGDLALPLDCGDVSTVLSKECGMTAYRVDNDRNMTLYEKLCGNVDNVPGTANVVDVRGTKLMVDVEMRVRMEFDGVTAPRIYINDILVSDPRTIRDEATRNAVEFNYKMMLETSGSCLAFCVTPGIDCVLDEITVYETRTELTSALYITEIATLPGNPLAPFVEIYNAGTEAVDLSTYAFGYVALNDGKEKTVGLALSDFIGGTLTAGETVLDNLTAEAAVLNPGETVIVYPVDTAADVADLIATVEGVTMAGFRAEYGLAADAKVLAVAADGFEMSATEHRYWFVCDALNEKGKPVVFETVTLNELKSSASTDSIVELVPSIAFGYEDDVTDTSVNADGAYNFGGDGYVQAGYSAHYLYGANIATGERTGLMISRCNDLIKDLQNVGALLDVQKDYFNKISEFRAGRYVNEGSFAITEMIPATDENDAFEAFEITNISESALNLYDFGLVSSGDAKYGSVTAWTRASLFELNPIENVVNPSLNGAFMVEPGVSVIVWNMTVEGFTVADFRQYHGIASNVPVVAVDSLGEKSVVAANRGTVSYGVATAAEIGKFLSGAADSVAKAVSDVTVPLHSIYYNIDGLYKYTWQELYEAGNMEIISAIIGKGMAGCDMLGVNLAEGDSLEGYFVRELVDGKYQYSLCDAEATVPAEDTTEYFIPKDTSTFVVYGSKQTIDFPADYAVSFSYGSGIYASKTSGSLMKAIEVSSYSYDDAGRGFGDLPYLLDVANRFVAVELTNGASAQHTLGKTEAKQGVNIAVKFNHYYTVTFLDGNGQPSATVTMNANTCGDVYTVLTDEYDTWLVNDVLYNAGDKVDIDGDTVVKPSFLGVSGQSTDAGADNAANATDMGLEPNSIDTSSAKGMTVAMIVVISVVGCAAVATACILIVKKRRAE